MKCWSHNKNNPANKRKFELDDFGNYGEVSSVVAMLTTMQSIRKSKNKRERMKRDTEKDNEINEWFSFNGG